MCVERRRACVRADMIRDDEALTNYWISMPKEMARLNCAAFIAGMVRGVLDGAGFVSTAPRARVAAHGSGSACGVQGVQSCTVQAVTTPSEGPRDKTVFLVKFTDLAMAREAP